MASEGLHTDTPMLLPMLLRIARIDDAADGIRSFELVQADGAALPPFTAGSHVSVQVPSGRLPNLAGHVSQGLCCLCDPLSGGLRHRLVAAQCARHGGL